MIHSLMHFLGLDSASSPAYLFWSGFAGDLIYIGAIGGLLKAYRVKNCKVKGCFRIGKHPVDGTPYKTCHKHATIELHEELHDNHQFDHPLQHQLLNKGKYRRDANGRFRS